MERDMSDGYYWAGHSDGTLSIVLREGGYWFTAGRREPLVNFDPRQVIEPVKKPAHIASKDCWCRGVEVVESFVENPDADLRGDHPSPDHL